MLPEKEIFSGYKIFRELKVKEKCFRLYEYKDGNFNEIFHEHVPKNRISSDSAIEFMKAFIARHSALGKVEMLRVYLNAKGKDPEAIQLGRVVTEYPERGVIRKYYSSGNFSAWYDEVIIATRFRL